MPDTDHLTILGQTVREPSRTLESFDAPDGCTEVEFTTDELASLCPVTSQPDYGSLTIRYRPASSCIESKSLKLYLWSFRDQAHFVEQLAATVASDVHAAIEPEWVEVEVRQNVRGGIETTATAELGERFPMVELSDVFEVELPPYGTSDDVVAITGEGAR